MMSYREQYIPFRATLQLPQKIKFKQSLSTDDYEAYHDHTDICLFTWISWKNH